MAAVGIAVHLVLRFSADRSAIASRMFLCMWRCWLAACRWLCSLGRKLWAGEFGSDFLAGVSIVTAIVLREYLVATIVVLMLSGGTALEEFATRRASRVLDALAKRMPSTAHRKSGKELADIAVGEIRVGDTLVVLPHEICPVDGVVVEGQGSMNEAYLTGEPFEVEKTPGSDGPFRRAQRRISADDSSREISHGFPLRTDHARDGGYPAETAAAAPARGHVGSVVHATGDRHCDCGLGTQR